MKTKEMLHMLFLGNLRGLDEQTQRKIIHARLRLIFETAAAAAAAFLLVNTLRNYSIPGLAACVLALCLAALVFWIEFTHIHDWIEADQIRKSHGELLDFMRVVRSQRHDFNLHVQTLASMIRRGEYDCAQQYMDTFARNVERTNEAFLVHEPAVSALISTYFELGQTKNIDMQFDICHSMEGAVLQDYQLNTVLGNLLQNAIDEVDGHKSDANRWILLYIMKRGRKAIIKVSNPFHGDIAKLNHIFDMGYTTKAYHEGVGLSNVKRILELNRGTISIEYRNQVLSVIAQVPLNIV